MNAVPAIQPQGAPGHPAPVASSGLHQVAPLSAAAVESAEVNRWIRLLMIPLVLASASFMALLATGQLWLIGAVIFTGPGLLIMSFIHLSMSSDSNGDN